jgi:hypothetical protein
MKRYIQMLLPAYAYLKRYYYVTLPVAVCFLLLIIVRPWSTRAESTNAASGNPMAPSTGAGGALLVTDRAPAGSVITYEFIMIQKQQRKVLAEAPKLKVGDDVNDVLKKLGTPYKDDPSYGKKDPAEPAKGRALSYYFGKRQMVVQNDFDPLVYIVFDEKGKLFAVASNITEVPELNWGAGFTAYHGIAH